MSDEELIRDQLHEEKYAAIKTIDRLTSANAALSAALSDAISTYGPQAETLVTAERQEAWIAALENHGSKL